MSPTLDLTDPLAAHHYMVAMRILHDLPTFAWYDSCFLAKFEAACRMLEILAPERLEAFTDAFAPLHTRADFEVRRVSTVLAPERFTDLLAHVSTLEPGSLKSHEQGLFGRSIRHDLPILTALQKELTPLVSRLAGEVVEPCYNFLSLYHGDGRCPPHLDAPSAKWTLDVCLAQSCEWPIHFSRPGPWPRATEIALGLPKPAYESHVLRPNDAILFSGSAQWHYRDAIPDGGFCHLAFLHYHPAGCNDLVDPNRWAAYFDLPALDVLIATFDALHPDRRE
ncbi:hypothetical protein [Novosphingobium resinovorum]|uniref:hypothetical protein n=1 Tax=Novosphingobium resinovorum TaxID=158500 RepID=UPI002ED340BB|nr:hypothetical protein [Novosphingobium resinovorum]